MTDANTAVPHNDPNVVLPAAVRKQMERAEQLQKQHYTPEGTLVTDQQDQQPQDAQPPQDEQGQQPSQDARAQQEAKAERERERERHRDRSLDGRIRQLTETVETLRGELHASRANERALSAELTALRQARVSAPASVAVPEFSEDEVETFGTEFLDVVGRRAQQIVEPIRAEFERKIAEMGATVAATKQTGDAITREQFFREMDSQLPNWRALNEDREFLSWLGLPDPFSGAIRFDLLDDAFKQLNVARTKAIFNGFVTREASVAPAHKAATSPAPDGKVDMASLAAPGRAQSAQAYASAEKPIIKPAEISRFYADVAAGRYTPEQVVQQEAILNEALKEGRVR